MQINHKYEKDTSPKISVIGIGGGGCNAVSRISSLDFGKVCLIAINTDFHSLAQCSADVKIEIGKSTTHGLGTGGDANLGKRAAEENFREIIAALKDTSLLYITAGFGGGTGSGATEIIARIAASLDIPTIIIASLPFSFESNARKIAAHEAVLQLQPFSNTVITIPNDRLLSICQPGTKLDVALAMMDDLLIRSINGISELINPDGIMHIDFSYIENMLSQDTGAYISVGYGSGADRVVNSIEDALSHPLLGSVPLNETHGLIIKMVANLTIDEVDEGLKFIREQAHPDIEIIPCIHPINTNDDSVKTAVIATGIGAIALSSAQEIKFQRSSVESVVPPLSTVANVDDEEKIVYPKSENHYEDELEVPTFIRRGYNLESN